MCQDGEGEANRSTMQSMKPQFRLKVKEVEEGQCTQSHAKLYEAAAAEMAESENNEGDGTINVESDDVVDADFEVVDEED